VWAFKVLNDWLPDVSSPMPDLRVVLPNIAKNRYFTKFDIRSFYRQIRVDKASGRLMVYSIDGVMMLPRVLIEGVKHAVSIAQTLVWREILQPMGFPSDGSRGSLWVDDVILASMTFGEHLLLLRDYFKGCHRIGLVLHNVKLELLATVIEWVGRQVMHSYVSPLPCYAAEVLGKIKPRDRKQLEVWVGQVQWISDWLMDLSRMLAPMLAMLKDAPGRNDPLNWTEKADAACEEVLCTVRDVEPMLTPDARKPFTVVSDACQVGWGGVLLQEKTEGGGDWRVVNLTGGTWNTRGECNSDPRWLELNGLRQVLRSRAWLLLNGMTLCVKTDHKSLEHKYEPHPADSVLKRRILADLSVFPITVSYLKGEFNVLSDGISRLSEKISLV
jgi:hypothetical protein